MYSIVMDKNKFLIKSCGITLYQGESLVDNLQFLIPKDYKGYDLGGFTVKMRYILPGNVSGSEDLNLSKELYNDTHYSYTLPIDSQLSTAAGDVTLYLTFLKTDDLEKKKYQMRTSSVTLTVKPYETAYNPELGYGDCSGSAGAGDDQYDVVEFSSKKNSDTYEVIEF